VDRKKCIVPSIDREYPLRVAISSALDGLISYSESTLHSDDFNHHRNRIGDGMPTLVTLAISS
jgi:hypothetical protein